MFSCFYKKKQRENDQDNNEKSRLFALLEVDKILFRIKYKFQRCKRVVNQITQRNLIVNISKFNLSSCPMWSTAVNILFETACCEKVHRELVYLCLSRGGELGAGTQEHVWHASWRWGVLALCPCLLWAQREHDSQRLLALVSSTVVKGKGNSGSWERILNLVCRFYTLIHSRTICEVYCNKIIQLKNSKKFPIF